MKNNVNNTSILYLPILISWILAYLLHQTEILCSSYSCFNIGWWGKVKNGKDLLIYGREEWTHKWTLPSCDTINLSSFDLEASKNGGWTSPPAEMCVRM